MSSHAARTADAHSPHITTLMVVVGIVLSLGLIAVSAMLNFRVGYRTADTEFDGWVYGLGAGMMDGLKAVAPFMAYWGWRNRDWLSVMAAGAMFLVFSWYSLTAALGFAAQHRVFKQGERLGAIEQRGDLRKDYERIDKRLAVLGVQRGEKEIEAAIAAVLARPVGEKGRTVEQLSARCSLNRKDSREACAEVANLTEEAERAAEYRRLDAEAKSLRSKLERLTGGVVMGSGDPQVDALQSLTRLTRWPLSRDRIEMMLSVLVALFVELGSGLGLYVSTTPWRLGMLKESRERRGDKAGRKNKKEDIAVSLGLVEDYMMERLEPRKGRELSTGDAYLDYRRWCTEKVKAPMTQTDFIRDFGDVATLAGIQCSGTNGRGVFRDVGVVGRR